jgi:hypothetical protein
MKNLMKQKSVNILAILVLALAFTLASARSNAQDNLITKDEAQKFCLEQWFLKLRVGHPPTREELRAFVTDLLTVYTDDIEIIDPNNREFFGKDVLKGKQDARRYYEAVLGNYPEWMFEILALYPTPEGFVLRYEGKNAGPVARFEGVDIIELRKEGGAWKISKLMGYYDRKPFFPAAQQ